MTIGFNHFEIFIQKPTIDSGIGQVIKYFNDMIVF